MLMVTILQCFQTLKHSELVLQMVGVMLPSIFELYSCNGITQSCNLMFRASYIYMGVVRSSIVYQFA